MARYIDADKLWNDRPQIPEGKSMDFGAGFSECMWGFSKLIRKQIDTESADVVPKSEVARKIFEEIEQWFDTRIDFYEKMKFKASLGFDKEQYEYAKTFIANLKIYRAEIAELKKKYTEG